MRRPSVRSRAARAAASSRVMPGPSRPRVETERAPQLRARDRGGAALHHDDPARDVRERRGLGGCGPTGQREREGADDGVARAGDVGDLVGPVDGDEGRGAVPREERHPATRSEEHTSELQSQSNLVCRLLLEKKKKKKNTTRKDKKKKKPSKEKK